MSTCHACHASSADGSPMICERDGCPGEIARIGDAMLRREERAHERGYFDRPDSVDERLAEWDRGVGP